MAKFFLFYYQIKTSIAPTYSRSFHGGSDRTQLGTIHAPGGTELKWDGRSPALLKVPLGITGARFHMLDADAAHEAAQRGDYGLRWEGCGEEVAA